MPRKQSRGQGRPPIHPLPPRMKTSPVHFSARLRLRKRPLANTIVAVAAARSLILMSYSMTGNAASVIRR